MDRLSIVVIFGGRSGEHEVSIRSAASVISALDKRKYDVVPIRIDKLGRWFLDPSVAEAGRPRGKAVESRRFLVPDPQVRHLLGHDGSIAEKIDVVFPLVHGTFGEDGCLQGLLELAEIPYVGSGVLGSSVGMDKIEQKHLLLQAGFPVVRFHHFRAHDWSVDRKKVAEKVARDIGFPNFVKPANLGSSVGISKVVSEDGLDEAIDDALKYDGRIIIEEAVKNVREIECSVLGNDRPKASVLGEIVPANDFYDYQAKYIDDNSGLFIPADLSESLSRRIREMALEAFRTCCNDGYARVDFLLDDVSGKLYLNELNTVPGFTSISMYPKLWEATGLLYCDLLDELIGLAQDKAETKKSLVREFTGTKEGVTPARP